MVMQSSGGSEVLKVAFDYSYYIIYAQHILWWYYTRMLRAYLRTFGWFINTGWKKLRKNIDLEIKNCSFEWTRPKLFC